MLFLGAGFSVPIGIPTMLGFLDSLRDGKHLSPEEQTDFDAIFRECATLAGLLGESARNIESIASFLSVLELIRPDYEFRGCVSAKTPRAAVSLLKRALCCVARPPIGTDAVHRARGLLGTLQSSGCRVTVVTTNYDLHVELAGYPNENDAFQNTLQCRLSPSLYQTFIDDCHYGKHSLAPLYSSHDSLAHPLLLKLHGSVNWYGSGRKVSVDARAYPHYARHPNGTPQYTSIDNIAGKPILMSGPSSNLEVGGEELEPLVVPPAIIKTGASSVLDEQWQFAADALSEADHVWFLGYSFPPSDSYMRYFLAGSLSQNARLRQIAVIDPDRSICFGRAAELFADSRFADVIQAYPYKWETIQPAAVLARDVLHPLRDDGPLREAERQFRAISAYEGQYLRPSVPSEELDPGRRSMLGRGRGRGRSRW